VAQAAAAAALEAGADCVAPMLEAFSRRRALVYEGLNRVFGVSCEPIQGAFYAFANAQDAIAKLAKNGSIAQANDIALCEYLLEEAEVAAVPGSAFGCEGFFRISFATSDENLKTALTRIQKALA
jgi:aspartate aminotransferase